MLTCPMQRTYRRDSFDRTYEIWGRSGEGNLGFEREQTRSTNSRIEDPSRLIKRHVLRLWRVVGGAADNRSKDAEIVRIRQKPFVDTT
jgi:hypothetical protein